MTENHRVIPATDPSFDENQRNFPQEELANYHGQHIAWSLDGLRIVASGETITMVEQKLTAAGINPAAVVHDYVPPPGQVLLL